MPTKPIAPRLAEGLRLLALGQLQTQAARSASLDAGALGVVSACAAIAAIILAVKSNEHLWVAALVLLGVSASLAIRALLLAGAEQNGPLVTDILDARASNDDESIEEGLLKDLAAETFANEQALARKDPLITLAVVSLVLAVLLELIGVR